MVAVNQVYVPGRRVNRKSWESDPAGTAFELCAKYHQKGDAANALIWGRIAKAVQEAVGKTMDYLAENEEYCELLEGFTRIKSGYVRRSIADLVRELAERW